MTVAARTAHGGASPPASYFAQTRQLGNALVLSVPLLAIYSLGLVLTGSGVMNGADFLTGGLHRALGPTGFVLVQLGLVVIAAGTAVILRRHARLSLRYVPLLLVEATAYGLALGSVVLFVMGKAHLLGPADGGYPVSTAVVLSAGAGFHEELVFRLGILSALQLAAHRLLGLPAFVAGVVAALLSSALFSLAHYLGTEPFAWYTFWYRGLAGLLFASIFELRGFAAAAYTHAIYDVYVMV